MSDRSPELVVVHVPMRMGSISGGRFDLAPKAITDAAWNYVARREDEDSVVTQLGVSVEECGDPDGIAEMAPAAAFEQIRSKAGICLEDEVGHMQPRRVLMLLGGDNSITRPGVQASTGALPLTTTGLITLDAHHDLRDTAGGLTNGNPVRALLEDGLPGSNVWQIGIQPFANSPAYAAVAREHGINVVTVDDVRARGIGTVMGVALDDLAGRTDAIYVDLDVDVLDRAFAPACPGARPGGLMPHELFEAARLAGAHPKVRAVDIVEVDPTQDVAEVTIMAAARCLLSFASGLAQRST